MLSKFHDIVAARRAKEGDRGFTLIELLVVVLIIGILAAIAIPVFLGQQNSAKDAAAKSDISNVKLAIVGWYAAGNTTAPAASDLQNYGYSATNSAAANQPVFFSSDAQTFCISEQSTSSSNTIYKLVSTSNAIITGSACTSKTG